jgi:hypothetical protein
LILKSTDKELWHMRLAFIGSRTSTCLLGKAVPAADERQRSIPGFDQEKFSHSYGCGRDSFLDRADNGPEGN